MNYHYYNYVSKVISEVNYSRFDRGRHQRRDVTPEEIGAKDHHFLDTNDPAKHVGKLAITRALANPQATGGNHPYASDIGKLHSLATHYERKMSDAEMYLNNHPLANKTRYKSAAHARSSFNKWAGHLHALHSDVLRAYHHANQQGHGLPKDFKGLDQSHVEDHAQKRGIDISQPFDAEAFRAKVRDFARHEVLVGDTNHPLYQGWKAPAKSPKGNAEEAAKQARMPEPPTREDASRNIKNLFKSLIKEQEKDEDEGADDSEAPGLETPDGKSLEGGSLGRAGYFLQQNPNPKPGSSEYKAAQDALKKRLKVARKIGMGTPTGGTDSGNIRTGIRTR